MKKKIIKKWIFIFFIILCFYFFIKFKKEDEKLKVYFFDIGQGDSSLIMVNNKKILVDGGPDNIVLRRLGEVLPYFDRVIDVIVLSHLHDDHVTGLIEVLKRYQVKLVVYQGDSPHSLVYDTFLKAVKDLNIHSIELNKILNWSLGINCNINMLPPNILNISDDENNSIMLRLNCRNTKFLFSGDNEHAVEEALLNLGINLKTDVFKASHHGSKTSNTEAFLRELNPDKIIISDGKNNKFNHPSPEVINRLKYLGIPIYRTDQIGTVKIIK